MASSLQLVNNSSQNKPCTSPFQAMSHDSWQENTNQHPHPNKGCQSEDSDDETFDRHDRSLYDLREKLGYGAYGDVYRAKYLGEEVAVKMLDTSVDLDESLNQKDVRDEIEREASILSKKHSSYVLRLLHYDSRNKWMITEYCSNGTLHDLLRDPMRMEMAKKWSNRLKWMTQVASGMFTIHAEQPAVLHRDLRTVNVFVTEHYNVKVGDFGLSKKVVGNAMEDSQIYKGSTLKMWQPPEVINGECYSKKSDVYSFGFMMHEVLEMKFPFSGAPWLPHQADKMEEALTSIHEWKVPEDRLTLPGEWHDCLEPYIALIDRCTAQNPKERPHFREICAILEKTSEAYEEIQSTQRYKKKKESKLGIAALCVLAAMPLSQPYKNKNRAKFDKARPNGIGGNHSILS